MSQAWYLMNSPPNRVSGFEDENYIDFAQEGFNELLNTFIAESLILFNSNLSKTQNIKGVVQNNVPDTKLKTFERQVLLPIGTCKAGMYIYYKNRYWIISGLVDNNQMYEKAIITLCQYKLKWQNSNNEIVERWTNVLSASQYNNGETGNKTITLQSNQLMLFMPMDNETILLDNPKRFFITKNTVNPKVYILTRNDDVIYDYGNDGGCINLIVTQDQIKTTDRPDLMLCDYISPTSSGGDVSGWNMEIEYLGNPTLKIGGNYKTFTAKLFDNNNNLISITPVWTIDKYTNSFDVITTDNELKIKINNVNLSGEIITLTATDSYSNISKSIQLTIVEL